MELKIVPRYLMLPSPALALMSCVVGSRHPAPNVIPYLVLLHIALSDPGIFGFAF